VPMGTGDEQYVACAVLHHGGGAEAAQGAASWRADQREGGAVCGVVPRGPCTPVSHTPEVTSVRQHPIKARLVDIIKLKPQSACSTLF